MSETPFSLIRNEDVVIREEEDPTTWFLLNLGFDPELKEQGVYSFSFDRMKLNVLKYLTFEIAKKREDDESKASRTSYGKRVSTTGINELESVVKMQTRGLRNLDEARLVAQRMDGSDRMEFILTGGGVKAELEPNDETFTQDDIDFLEEFLRRADEVLTPATEE